MRKASRLNPPFASRMRLLAAASLACSLALFGCTTDRYPGAGSPERSGPAVGPANPSSTPGSESGQPIPMMSSMVEPVSAQVVRRPNVDALATAAANAGFRGRVLGRLDPGTTAAASGVGGVDYPTGQFVNPAVIANPQYTVNSAINSVGVEPAIGDLGTAAAVATTAVGSSAAATGAITSSATTLPSVTAATAGAPLTPTTAAIRTTVGQFAAGARGTVITNTTAPIRASNATTSAITASQTVGSVSKPIVISQSGTGVTITNVGAVTTGTGGHAIVLNAPMTSSSTSGSSTTTVKP